MLLIRLRQPSVSTVSLPSNPGPANSQQALKKRPRRRAPARVWASWAAGRDAKGDARAANRTTTKDRPAVNQPAGCSDRRRGSKILRHLATPVQVAVRGGDAQSAGSRERHPAPPPHVPGSAESGRRAPPDSAPLSQRPQVRESVGAFVLALEDRRGARRPATAAFLMSPPDARTHAASSLTWGASGQGVRFIRARSNSEGSFGIRGPSPFA